MSKIILIRRKNTSDWVSCQSITRNLETLYRTVFSEQVETVEISSTSNKYDHWNTAKYIAKSNPSKIVFIDHFPHPVDIITCLAKQGVNKNIEFIFHIFGDFTLQSKHWLGIEDILKNLKVLFICASDKQVSLLENLINSKNNIVRKLPFPIEDSFFKFDKELKSEQKDFTFLYTGRLSAQKNIIELIQNFHQFNTTLNPNTKLIIAGPYDDLGVPFLGKTMKSGSYGLLVENLISKLGNKNIQVIGNCDHEKLKEVYHQSDAYISLSVHNDEDYGMSPAEALCCGLPCLLTDWGGFASFSLIDKKRVLLTPVEIKKNKISHQLSDVVKKMALISSKRLNQDESMELSQKAIKYLGITQLKDQLKDLLNNKFSNGDFLSFDTKFRSLCSTQLVNNSTPYFKASHGGYSSLYEEVYTPYLRSFKSE
jgi:glycosyltransferase involved in cell wall biosynthesis